MTDKLNILVYGYRPDDAAHAGADARPARSADARAAIVAAAQDLHAGKLKLDVQSC